MTIQFVCRCGKQLMTKDENVGKRLKCPGCGAIVEVPEPVGIDPSAETLPSKSRPAERKLPMVSFPCSCGQTLRARADQVGRSVQCPSCGKTTIVPRAAGGEPETVVTRPPKIQRGKVAPPPEAEEEEEAPRPTRKGTPSRPAGRGSGALIAALVVILLLGAGAFAGYWFYFRTPKAPVAAQSGPGTNTPQAVNPGSSNQPAVNQAEKTPALTGDNQILAYVPADAVGFVSVRFGDWWNGDLGKKVQQQLAQNNINPSQEMEKQTGLGPGDVDQVLTVLTAPAPTAYWTLVTTTKPIDLKKVWANLAPDAAPKDFQGKSYLLSPKNAVAFFLVNDHTLVLGPDPAIQQFIQRSPQPSASGPLSNALALAAAKHSIVAGVVPPPQFLDQAKKNMRGPIQGFEPVLELQSATLTADLGNDLDLELRATYPDDARAQKARDAARNAMGLIRGILVPQLESKLQGPENATFLQAAKPLEDALANIAIEQQGPAMDIHLQTQGGGLARVVDTTPAMIQKIRQASIRTVSQNNLKQLALAMHAYADLHEGKLPPAVVTSKDGKPLYSWRVEMLPFVEEAALYNEFHKDEPWDSPNNIKLLPRMPKVFAPVGTVQTPEPNSTFYQVLNGPGAIFDGSRQLPLTGIADGTSNTIMIVEAGEAVPWTKPADLPYQANGPLPKLGGLFPDGFNAAFADGAIYFISRTVSEKTLRALITAAAGDVPGPDFQTR